MPHQQTKTVTLLHLNHWSQEIALLARVEYLEAENKKPKGNQIKKNYF